MEKNAKETICPETLESVSGGKTEEEYYADFERFGHIDTEAHLLEGTTCRDCGWGKLRFWKYQPGPFGNQEAVYECDSCREYTVAALRK